MKVALVTFMSIAITVISIISFIWNLLYPHTDTISHKVSNYLQNSSVVVPSTQQYPNKLIE